MIGRGLAYGNALVLVSTWARLVLGWVTICRQVKRVCKSPVA